jgi:hypothetical protein
MLARYSIERGRKLADYPRRIREGKRQDTRKHTSHVLRPDAEEVTAYLADGSDGAWRRFAAAYRAALRARFRDERARFDELAALATAGDVFIGCSCPTVKNPDVRRCHTALALAFLRDHYPTLKVELPDP